MLKPSLTFNIKDILEDVRKSGSSLLARLGIEPDISFESKREINSEKQKALREHVKTHIKDFRSGDTSSLDLDLLSDLVNRTKLTEEFLGQIVKDPDDRNASITGGKELLKDLVTDAVISLNERLEKLSNPNFNTIAGLLDETLLNKFPRKETLDHLKEKFTNIMSSAGIDQTLQNQIKTHLNSFDTADKDRLIELDDTFEILKSTTNIYNELSKSKFGKIPGYEFIAAKISDEDQVNRAIISLTRTLSKFDKEIKETISSPTKEMQIVIDDAKAILQRLNSIDTVFASVIKFYNTLISKGLGAKDPKTGEFYPIPKEKYMDIINAIDPSLGTTEFEKQHTLLTHTLEVLSSKFLTGNNPINGDAITELKKLIDFANQFKKGLATPNELFAQIETESAPNNTTELRAIQRNNSNALPKFFGRLTAISAVPLGLVAFPGFIYGIVGPFMGDMKAMLGLGFIVPVSMFDFIVNFQIDKGASRIKASVDNLSTTASQLSSPTTVRNDNLRNSIVSELEDGVVAFLEEYIHELSPDLMSKCLSYVRSVSGKGKELSENKSLTNLQRQHELDKFIINLNRQDGGIDGYISQAVKDKILLPMPVDVILKMICPEKFLKDRNLQDGIYYRDNGQRVNISAKIVLPALLAVKNLLNENIRARFPNDNDGYKAIGGNIIGIFNDWSGSFDQPVSIKPRYAVKDLLARALRKDLHIADRLFISIFDNINPPKQ